MKYDNCRIILASASPRRRELLARLIPKFDIVCADIDESVPCGILPREACRQLAVMKAEAVYKAYPEALVIAADTVVEKDGHLLGKPADKAQAFEMLKALSGSAHMVHTGLCVRFNGKCLSCTESTQVFFDTLSDDEINSYIASGEPLDKAGAYGIQGKGGCFVKKVDGCFYNVVGLPLNRLKNMLASADISDGD